MQIQVNGETMTLAADSNVAALLARLELQGKRLAVEVNRELVPRSEFERQALRDGDTVEIVHAIGGG